MTRTARAVTHELMRSAGMTTVFGNPGTTEVPFLADWPDDFRFVLGLQESVAVAMADGYAAVLGEPAVVCLHSAGGVGHGLGSVFTAHRNRTPMVILAGQQARTLLAGEPYLGATDPALFPRPYVRWSHEPARAADVPAAFARAYSRACQPPPGPAFLSIPVDDWDAPAEPVRAPARPREFGPHPDDIAELADALGSSTAPALVVGPAVDASGSVPEVVTLAERLGAPVWEAPVSSRCSFPEDHELFAGFLSPERIALGEELSPYDLVAVLGAPAFTYHVVRDGAASPLPPLIVVSDDEDVLARAPGRGIRSGVGTALRELSAALPAAPNGGEPATLPRPEAPEPSTPMTGAFVMHTIAATLPVDALVVEEAATHRTAMHQHLPIRARQTGFLTTASGALGHGIGAAVGAALAAPERTVVALLGDGAAMYGIQALWTAARENAGVVFVILDNGEYAAVRVLGHAAGGSKLPGVELGGLDFVSLAAGMGCPAQRVARPAELAPALREAAARPGPSLLHVAVAADAGALY